MPIATPKVCVFDFDGTLVDSMGGFADIAAEVIEKNYGIPFETGRRRYLETSGIPFFQQLEIICPQGKYNSDCAAEFESRKLEGFFEAAPEAETLEGLKILQRNSIKLVVSSNNFQDNVDAYLRKHPMPMDLALGFDNNGLEKGKPHFMMVQSKFKVQPEEMLFCGDSLEDGQRALKCQVPFIGKLGTFTRKEFEKRFPKVETIESILELPNILLGI
jgi:phosphoglycolate phosphatase-like HAD superfamily hydrolase